jgi:hypothetical protein
MHHQRKTTQYLIYGIQLPYGWHKAWEETHGKDFYNTFSAHINDESHSAIPNIKDGVSCLIDNCNGSFIFLGYCYKKSMGGENLAEDQPIEIPKDPIPPAFKEYIVKKINEIFSLSVKEEELRNYLVTMVR